MVYGTIFWINILLSLILIGMGITIFIFIVKLARRGIKALDIYIKKNSGDGL